MPALFNSAPRRPKPARVPTDTVIPFHYFDHQLHCTALILHTTWRFDDVLDAGKLKAALATLVEMEGWRKVGGRVRQGDNGRYEYHIPDKFTEERPAFQWAHVEHQMPIKEHELASRLPSTPGNRSRPAVFEEPATYTDLIYTPSTPRYIDDWLHTDAAALSVLVTTFADATLISLTWGHFLWDAMGLQAFMQAWIAVLDGREQDVPPMVGYDVDPFDNVGVHVKPEKSLFYDRLIKGWQWWLFVLNQIIELVWWPAHSNRAICIPGDFVKSLREEAMRDLSTGSDNKQIFLSEGDILFAWWSRIAIKAQALNPNTLVMLMNVINMRGTIGDALPDHAAYLGNATCMAPTFLTAAKLLSQSLGQTALQIRNDLLHYRTSEQVHAFVALHKESLATTGHEPMCGSPSMIFNGWSNWHRGRFLAVDFSSAVVRVGLPLGERTNGVGVPSYLNVTGTQQGFSTRNLGPLVGRDSGGNWWMSWKLREYAWAEVEREFEM